MEPVEELLEMTIVGTRSIDIKDPDDTEVLKIVRDEIGINFFSVSPGIFSIESFPQMCFEGNCLQNRLRVDKNESRSLLAVDIQGHQCGVPFPGMKWYDSLT